VVPSKGSGGGGGDGIERFQLENCDFIIEPVGTASVQVKVLVKVRYLSPLPARSPTRLSAACVSARFL
jgi:hypothetical protein